MRLTKKYDDGSYGLEKVDCEVEKKLGQLEDIEDELGIDLVTLFKAFKNGIYHKKYPYPYPFALLCSHYSDNTFKISICAYGDRVLIKLKDYGKTWALTKEELEK